MNGVTTEVEQRPRRQEVTVREGREGGNGTGPLPRIGRQFPRYPYLLDGHVRVGRLRLARQWMEAGSIYQAIRAYVDILDCCAGSYAADAAVEDLLDLAQTLEWQGRFYAAQGIFRHLENYFEQ